jgi:hypothetical protein
MLSGPTVIDKRRGRGGASMRVCSVCRLDRQND